MKITLEIEITGEVFARFEGPGSEKIRELFGQDRIPTPFTFLHVREIEHWAAHIITVIRSKNPGCVVEWSPERCQQLIAFWELEDFKKEVRTHGVH